MLAVAAAGHELVMALADQAARAAAALAELVGIPVSMEPLIQAVAAGVAVFLLTCRVARVAPVSSLSGMRCLIQISLRSATRIPPTSQRGQRS